MMTTRLALTLLTIAIAAGLCPAQIERLRSSIVTSSSVGEAERQEIGRFVSDYATALAEGDAGELSRASQELRRPLENAAASVAFRAAYADALLPILEDLLSKDRVESELVAMRLAGELATDTAFELLIGRVGSDDHADRVFACGRLARSFGVLVSNTTPTASPEVVTKAIRALASVIEEGGPIEADASVRALSIATSIPHAGFERVNSTALSTLARRASARARALDLNSFEIDELTVLLDACVAGQGAMISPRPPDRDTTVEVIGLGADLIALVYARFQNDMIPEDSRTDVQVLRDAENVIVFARRHLGENVNNGESLADTLERGDDRTFPTQTLALIGASGELVRRYGFDPARFDRSE